MYGQFSTTSSQAPQTGRCLICATSSASSSSWYLYLWCVVAKCSFVALLLKGQSSEQLFRWSPSGGMPHPGWGLSCLFCLVYFFSIFGVWFVHSLLDDGAEGVEGDGGGEVGGKGESGGNGAVHVAPGRAQAPHSARREVLRELRLANERLAKVHARSVRASLVGMP